MDDAIEEELAIMDERDNEETGTINLAAFKLPIKELNNPPAVTVTKNDSIEKSYKLMQEKKIGSLVIIEGKRVCGIVTERDILMKAIGLIDDMSSTPISKIMTEDPITLHSDDMIAHVMHNMHIGGFRHVPILDENDEVSTIVSIKDVLSFIIDRFPQEIINVTSVPYRGKPHMDGA